jgi:hypothetical protein
MAKNIKKIAEILGAKIVAQVPETGGGAFAAYRLGEIVGQIQAHVECSHHDPTRDRAAEDICRPEDEKP